MSLGNFVSDASIPARDYILHYDVVEELRISFTVSIAPRNLEQPNFHVRTSWINFVINVGTQAGNSFDTMRHQLHDEGFLRFGEATASALIKD